jgi:L-alanine-DL-glutamate epimerase-like enolase superfamily enzyme
MKITKVNVEPMPIALGLRGDLVKLTDELGNAGVGEASPLANYSPDDIAGCPHLLHDVGSRIGNVDDDVDAIDERLDVFGSVLDHAPASRFALETALLAILSRRKETSIARMLGGKKGACVPLSGVVGANGDISAWSREAAASLERGIRVIKVKVGRSKKDFDSEHVALRALRKMLPADVELRLDANGSFGDRARERLASLEDLDPSYVEEPTHGEALCALGKCDVPWAADETLASKTLVDRLLDDSACAVVILKPTLLGGLLYARKIAIRARARNLGVVVTHLFDGNVAHGAACELALSLDAPLACGLDIHPGLVSASSHLKTPGFVTAP